MGIAFIKPASTRSIWVWVGPGASGRHISMLPHDPSTAPLGSPRCFWEIPRSVFRFESPRWVNWTFMWSATSYQASKQQASKQAASKQARPAISRFFFSTGHNFCLSRDFQKICSTSKLQLLTAKKKPNFDFLEIPSQHPTFGPFLVILDPFGGVPKEDEQKPTNDDIRDNPFKELV